MTRQRCLFVSARNLLINYLKNLIFPISKQLIEGLVYTFYIDFESLDNKSITGPPRNCHKGSQVGAHTNWNGTKNPSISITWNHIIPFPLSSSPNPPSFPNPFQPLTPTWSFRECYTNMNMSWNVRLQHLELSSSCKTFLPPSFNCWAFLK